MKKVFKHKNKKYNYYVLIRNDFIKLLKENKYLLKSFIKLMKIKKGKYYNISHLQYDKKKSIYSFITTLNNKQIINIAMLRKNTISNVITLKKYRNMGFCKKNIKKLIKFTKYKNFKLYTLIKNTSAIKCYESVGFIIHKRIGEKYKMEYHFKK